jgi:hypothetical protein
MTHNEIRKALYKQNPEATFRFIRKGVAYYYAFIKLDRILSPLYTVNFEIPVNDMGDADFMPTMEAKLLQRYIITKDENTTN